MKQIKLTITAVAALAVAGQSLADNSSTFGAVSSTSVNAGESYAGITLTASAANFGTGGFDDYTTSITLKDINGDDVAFNPAAGLGPGGADGFGSTLTILAGIASANTTVDIKVRKANDNEVFGYSTVPPMNDSGGYASVLSDIYDITGIAATGPAVDGKTPTDAFAIQLTYEGGSYIEDYVYEWGNTASWTEADIVTHGEIQVAFFNTSTATYKDDDLGNFTPGTTVVENFSGSYSDFVSAQGFVEADLADYVGSWGVDQTNNHVWAIVDHNTEFAVIPEPQSAVIFAAAGMTLLARRRRR